MNDVETTIRAMMSRIFSGEMLCRVTLSGRGIGIVFKLAQSYILGTMKDAVNQVHNDTPAFVIESVAQKFLKHAPEMKSGISRREKKIAPK